MKQSTIKEKINKILMINLFMVLMQKNVNNLSKMQRTFQKLLGEFLKVV